MTLTSLADAIDSRLYGGKTAALAIALRAGLPVPDGLALSVSEVADLPDEIGTLVEGLLQGPYAVRSSAPKEDGVEASFAGIHSTSLNVPKKFLEEAIRGVEASAYSPRAEEYRRRLGVSGAPEMAVCIQTFIPAELSGVLFTRNPATGADEYVVEAVRGLGEAIVQGIVDPDQYRLTGETVDPPARLGHQTVMFQPSPVIGTLKVEVETHSKLLLGTDELDALVELTEKCRDAFPSFEVLDIEWAIHDDILYLLQVRPALVRRPA